MATNEELAARWQAGDRGAFDELLAKNEGLLVRARVIFGRGCERQEAECLALIAMLDAANRHDPSRGAFSTCYMLCARTAFAHVRHYEAAAKRNATVYSIGAGPTMRRWEGLPDRSAENPATIAERKDEQAHQLKTARKRLRRLNERDKEIIFARMRDESFQAISDRIGISLERARQLHIRAMTWLRMSDEEFAEEQALRRSLGAKSRGNKPVREAVLV